MGLIKAGIGALSGTLADQWKEFIYCDSLDEDVLVKKGQKKTGNRSSNKKGSENVISDGSGLVVNEGQCMLIVEQGNIIEVCAEPGEYTYDTSLAPSLFAGELSQLGSMIQDLFDEIGKRFTFGGTAAVDQRVYYLNTKEIKGNKFGTMNPIPFRIVDKNIGLDVDVSVRCSGVYSYRITNPVLFYRNVSANVEQEYLRDDLAPQLKTEFVSALQTAFAELSAQGIRPSELPAHAERIALAMNDALSQKWGELRGISIVSVALNPITLTEEDAALIKHAQRSAILRDPTMAAATLVGAQADAMRDAANNEGGAMAGFMGMNMANMQGGMNAQNLYAMSQPSPKDAPADTWVCSCGKVNSGKFCSECGNKKPESNTWQCSCGKINDGKFCSECGSKKPEGTSWTCSCGKVNEGKFCSECGSPKQ